MPTSHEGESGGRIIALALEAIITNNAEILYWIHHQLCSTLGAEALDTPIGTPQQIPSGPHAQAHDEALVHPWW